MKKRKKTRKRCLKGLTGINSVCNKSKVFPDIVDPPEQYDSLKLAFSRVPVRTSMIFWNVRGLANKLKILDYLATFDVIILAETHIERDAKNILKKLPTTHTWSPNPALRIHKKGRAMGGLLMGVRNTLKQITIRVSSELIVARKVEINRQWHTVIGIYRKPNKSLSYMNSELGKLLSQDPDRTIVLGDLNVYIGTLGNRGDPTGLRNTKHPEFDKEGRKWLNFFQSYGLQVLNGNKECDWKGEITRRQKRSSRASAQSYCPGTVIDYAFTTERVFEEIHTFEVVKREESDHDPIIIKWADKDIKELRTSSTLESIKLNRLDKVMTHEDAWKFINYKRRILETGTPPEQEFFSYFQSLLKETQQYEPMLRHQNKKAMHSIGPSIEKIEVSVALSVARKIYPESKLKRLVTYFQNLLEGKSIPNRWRETEICPTYNRGYKISTTSYKAVYRNDALYKVWAHFLCDRLTKEILQKIDKTHWILGRFRSALDNIYILNAMIQESIPGYEMLSALFIDLSKAFETVDRGCLWKIIKEAGISQYLIDCCREIYKTTLMKIGEAQFYTTNGLKRDCPLSPVLLALYIGFINRGLAKVRETRKELKINVWTHFDEMVIVANRDDLRSVMSKVKLQNATIYKKVNITANDMKILVFSKSGVTRSKNEEWLWDQIPVEKLKTHTYMGFTFQSNGQFDVHTQNLSSEAHRMLRFVYKLGKGKDLRTRLELFDKLVKPGLMHGSEIFGWKKYECLEKVQVRYLMWVMDLDPYASEHKVLLAAQKRLPLHIGMANVAMEYEKKGKRRVQDSGDRCLSWAIDYIQMSYGEGIRKIHIQDNVRWSQEDECNAMRNSENYCKAAKKRHIEFYKRSVVADASTRNQSSLKLPT